MALTETAGKALNARLYCLDHGEPMGFELAVTEVSFQGVTQPTPYMADSFLPFRPQFKYCLLRKRGGGGSSLCQISPLPNHPLYFLPGNDHSLFIAYSPL